MAIQISREELLRQGAKIHIAPEKPPKMGLVSSAPAPTVDLSGLASAIYQLGVALASARAEQREAIIQAIKVNEEVAVAIAALRDPALVNVDVHIVKRDALGRILDVEFRSAKA